MSLLLLNGINKINIFHESTFSQSCLPSKRVQHALNTEPYYFNIMPLNKASWNINNRKGFIQGAISENCLLTDILTNKLQTIQKSNIEITKKYKMAVSQKRQSLAREHLLI